MKGVYDYKRAHSIQIQKIKDSPILTAKEKEIILAFDKSLENQRTSLARREGVIERLNLVRSKGMFKTPFDESDNREAIEAFCKNVNDYDIKERTRQDYKSTVKQFYTWLHDGITPPSVAWLKRKQLYDKRLGEKKTIKDLLTVDEQKKLIRATSNERDYAIIKLWLETGMRPNEIIRLRIKDLDFSHPSLCIVTVPMDTKTGSRRVPIAASLKAVNEWLAVHPFRNNPESPLWVQFRRNRDQPLDYKGMADMVRLLRNRAKIGKRLHPYIFRYTSYNTKALAGWNEAKIKAYHGLDHGSKMLTVYVVTESRDLADDVLSLAGKKVIKKSERLKEFVMCPRCDMENAADMIRCSRCGFILDLEQAQEHIEKAEIKLEAVEEAILRRVEAKLMEKIANAKK